MRRVVHGRQWSLDNKLALWGILVAIVAIVVPVVVTTSGSSSTQVGTNKGQINIGGVVNNYWQPGEADPSPSGPNIHSNSCPNPLSGFKPKPGSTLTIDLWVALHRNGECFWPTTVIGQTPSTVEYEIRYLNTSTQVQKNVIVSAQLAKGLRLVPGTTYIMDSVFPKGQRINSDKINSGGIDLGAFAPKAEAFIVFQATIPSVSNLGCGSNLLRTVAYVQPKGLDYFYNDADITVGRACPSPSK